MHRFIHTLFLALDACFCLKRLHVSSEKKDPALGTGLAYFIEDVKYHKYLLTITDQKEISTCTGFPALDHANTDHGLGYATSGVGICCCTRHELIEKNGVGDLQKSKRSADNTAFMWMILTMFSLRYANIDYIC